METAAFTFYDLMNMWWLIVIIAISAAFLTFILANILNRIKTTSEYMSQDYFVSFFWCASLIITTIVLTLLAWGVRSEWGWLLRIFPILNIFVRPWLAFAINTIIFYFITVVYYWVRIRGYYNKVNY
jgi:hypothetical protein